MLLKLMHRHPIWNLVTSKGELFVPSVTSQGAVLQIFIFKLGASRLKWKR